MRKTSTLILYLVLAFISAGNAATTVYQLGVDGLACPFCVYGLEKQLNKIDGIENIDIDIKKGLVIVFMREGAILYKKTVEEAVRKAGFTLRSFSQTGTTE